MVLTKDELPGWLEEKTQPFMLLNPATLSEVLITMLNWHDNEPRDINTSDLYELESFIATEVDRTLTSIEIDICNNTDSP